eukprot:1232470-Amphidinium_carterae.2
MESDDERGHADEQSDVSSSEGGLDDSTGCWHRVCNLGAVGGRQLLRNRARRHTHSEAIVGRWRPRPPAQFELDETIFELHARLSRLVNHADGERENEAGSYCQSGDDEDEGQHWQELNAAMRRMRDRQRLEMQNEGPLGCSEGHAPHVDEDARQSDVQPTWLAPSLRVAIGSLSILDNEGSHRVVDLAEVRAWHFESLQSTAAGVGAADGSHGDRLSVFPQQGSSESSSPGSPCEDDYDCSSYGTSRYAEWSSGMASSPGEVSDTFFDMGEIVHFLWEGDGPYPPFEGILPWSPILDSSDQSRRILAVYTGMGQSTACASDKSGRCRPCLYMSASEDFRGEDMVFFVKLHMLRCPTGSVCLQAASGIDIAWSTAFRACACLSVKMAIYGCWFIGLGHDHAMSGCVVRGMPVTSCSRFANDHLIVDMCIVCGVASAFLGLFCFVSQGSALLVHMLCFRCMYGLRGRSVSVWGMWMRRISSVKIKLVDVRGLMNGIMVMCVPRSFLLVGGQDTHEDVLSKFVFRVFHARGRCHHVQHDLLTPWWGLDLSCGATCSDFRVHKVCADGRCMYRSLAVGLGLLETQWRVPLVAILTFLQSERARELSLTDDIREWAILSARMAMREGVLHEKYWPTEPHLAAFARARECHVRVWNEGQSVGHEWLHYGDVGQCVSITQWSDRAYILSS